MFRFFVQVVGGYARDLCIYAVFRSRWVSPGRTIARHEVDAPLMLKCPCCWNDGGRVGRLDGRMVA